MTPTTVTLMWEAKAAQGRGAELLAWARERARERARELAYEPLRREVFRAGPDRVLVMTWWEAADVAAELPELPEPAADLSARPVHRWRFESLGVA
ncbi:hypothetical protein ACIHCQ_04025 [Streptomyces sp. NPDC052236]|uniref:hypothetical protein n=1 Tax=Streptomyces sp. NPDC052236 TaxID=3365686 RepID=UPI0037D2EE90